MRWRYIGDTSQEKPSRSNNIVAVFSAWINCITKMGNKDYPKGQTIRSPSDMMKNTTIDTIAALKTTSSTPRLV